MRKLLIVAALATATLVQAQPSQAYFRGNWCANMDIGGAVQERCEFASFQACQRSMINTPRSFCTQNQ
jgi:hypothetical protein